MNGGPASSILAQCSMENASGLARAVDQKGFHFPRKTEDAVGGKETGGEFDDLGKWVLERGPDCPFSQGTWILINVKTS